MGFLGLAQGDFNVEFGAFAGFGFAVQRAVVFLDDDLVADGESQAGPLANGFGGEEGVEEFLSDGFWHASTVVCDRNSHLLPLPNRRLNPNLGLGEC